MLQKFVPYFSSGYPEIQVVSPFLERFKYRRDYLVKLERNKELAEKQLVENLFNNSTEDDIMSNSNAIINIARTGDVKATENALQSAIGQAIKRALWVAERKDEFMAIPVLQELDGKYNPGGKSSAPAATIKDAKDLKLTKDSKLDDRIWQAILKKANKLGVVVKSSGNVAEVKIPKKEAEVFSKAVAAVRGIIVG